MWNLKFHSRLRNNKIQIILKHHMFYIIIIAAGAFQPLLLLKGEKE